MRELGAVHGQLRDAACRHHSQHSGSRGTQRHRHLQKPVASRRGHQGRADPAGGEVAAAAHPGCGAFRPPPRLAGRKAYQ